MAAGGTSLDEIRILLIGHTGHGKSSSGNTILGKDVFKEGVGSKSETSKSKCETGCRFGKQIVVVDTPGIFDTQLDEQLIKIELLRALTLTTPGFHAIVFVLQPTKFSDEIQKTCNKFFEWFGKGVEKYALMILTHTKDEVGVNKYFEDPADSLVKLKQTCGPIVVPLDNMAAPESKDKQVKYLLSCVEQISRINGSHFTNMTYKLAELFVKTKYPKRDTVDSLVNLEEADITLSDLEEYNTDMPEMGYTSDSTDNDEQNVSKTGCETDSLLSNLQKFRNDMEKDTKLGMFVTFMKWLKRYLMELLCLRRKQKLM